MGWTNDLSVDLVHTIIAADTVSGDSIMDTAYTPVERVHGSRYIQFFSTIDYKGTPLIYTNDTFFVDVLSSADKITWDVNEVDTFLTVGSSWSPLILDADADVFGNYIKGRLIYKTAPLGGDQPDSLGNVRGIKLKLWYMLK